jgi:hypothetical protein
MQIPKAPVGVLLVLHASHSHSSLEYVHSPGLALFFYGAEAQARPSQAVGRVAGKILVREFFGQRAYMPMAD